jgi:NAD(P)-dependent dehydrogenase (short-subunit alcohol dehydrogenase family)
VATTVDAAGHIDVLVNNAGIGAIATVEETDEDAFRAILETNVIGAHRLARAVIPHMRAHGGGHIVQVSSINAVIAVPLGGAYSASKYALEGLSESMSHELHRDRIFVTLIEPGVFRTAIDENMAVGRSELAQATARRRRESAEHAPPLRLVGDAIVVATRADPPPFRVPVGDDAQFLSELRAKTSDEDLAVAIRNFGRF